MRMPSVASLMKWLALACASLSLTACAGVGALQAEGTFRVRYDPASPTSTAGGETTLPPSPADEPPPDLGPDF